MAGSRQRQTMTPVWWSFLEDDCNYTHRGDVLSFPGDGRDSLVVLGEDASGRD